MTANRERQLVLVVEDYQDAREMYTAYLQFSGFEVCFVDSKAHNSRCSNGLLHRTGFHRTR